VFTAFSIEGIGIHTGCHSRATVEPNEPGTGIIFVRDETRIQAIPSSISSSHKMATSLVGPGGTQVQTVEHLLAALAAFGESNVQVTVSGPELPILDGSAKPWADALATNGSTQKPRFFFLKEKTSVAIGDSFAHMIPLKEGDTPSLEATIDFNSNELEKQTFTFHPIEDSFFTEIAPARTFALESQVSGILDAGLARGGSLDCALVIGQSGPLNPDGQRFTNEPVRHKILDAIGDLFLLGALPWAECHFHKPGHALLHKLVHSVSPTEVHTRWK
jgi:UDP-3-O-[3-hydroxymyristoyl] N-acetylglucosamine deacetylase